MIWRFLEFGLMLTSLECLEFLKGFEHGLQILSDSQLEILIHKAPVKRHISSNSAALK